MSDKPTVFISYSHKDEAWKDLFKPHLKVLEQVGHIAIWDDRQIDAGAEWYDEIKKALNNAAIAVCLISSDFLASDFCVKEEVPALLERREKDGMLLIPLLLRPCAWKAVPWIKPIQMLPRDGKSVSKDFKDDWDTAFTEVANAIFKLVSMPGYQPPVPLSLWKLLPESNISIDRLPVTGAELFGRQKEMELLNEAWDKHNLNVISFIAWGGVGKSTLINKWLESMKADNFRGAQRVFGWSFYSQGTGERATSADLFIDDALHWFKDPDPKAGSPWDKGQRLADLVRKERTLLVLDGLEPLQSAHDFEKGKIKDAALSVLVNELSRENPGLLIITTREKVADLKEADDHVVQKSLEQLTPEAGRALLRTAGVRGTDRELEDASSVFGNQALAIRLLGSYLYGEEGHRIGHASDIPGLEHIPDNKGRHPRRVMAAFEARFGEGPEVEFLRILGLFDKPAEQSAVEALLRGKTISHLTKQIRKLGMAGQKALIAKLRDLNLITKVSRHDKGKIDAHPLVREHFGVQLKTNFPYAWREGNSRLYEYFCKQSPELPDTIDEMSLLFSAVAYGCSAGRHQEAFYDVYWKRMHRGNNQFCTKELGAFGSDLVCLSHFFEKQWRTPVMGLKENNKSYILGNTGFNLRALGRLSKSIEPIQIGWNAEIEQKNWQNAAIGAGLLSEIYLTMGSVKQAIEYAKKSVEYADRSGDASLIIIHRTTLADALHQAGRIEEAERVFLEVEEMQKTLQPENPYLYSVQGFQYCDLLLGKGNYEEALKRASWTFKISTVKKWLVDIGFDHLALGNAHLLKATKEGGKDYLEAEKHLNEAGEWLRKANVQEFIACSILARAELYRIKKDFNKARHDLDEALTISTRGEMKLHEADCHLGYARLYLAEGDKEKAQTELSTAKEMINDMGYHRRDKDVREIGEMLAEE